MDDPLPARPALAPHPEMPLPPPRFSRRQRVFGIVLLMVLVAALVLVVEHHRKQERIEAATTYRLAVVASETPIDRIRRQMVDTRACTSSWRASLQARAVARGDLGVLFMHAGERSGRRWQGIDRGLGAPAQARGEVLRWIVRYDESALALIDDVCVWAPQDRVARDVEHPIEDQRDIDIKALRAADAPKRVIDRAKKVNRAFARSYRYRKQEADALSDFVGWDSWEEYSRWSDRTAPPDPLRLGWAELIAPSKPSR